MQVFFPNYLNDHKPHETFEKLQSREQIIRNLNLMNMKMI